MLGARPRIAKVENGKQTQGSGRQIFIGVLLAATLGWMALLLLIAAWPNPTSPDLGPAEGSMLVPILGHFILFAILGVLVSYYVCYIKGRQYVLVAVMVALLIGLIWGLVTEGYQTHVATREASFMDLVTDMLGAGFGALLTAGMYRVIRLPAHRR